LSINIEVHRDRKKAKEIIIIMGHEEIEVEKRRETTGKLMCLYEQKKSFDS